QSLKLSPEKKSRLFCSEGNVLKSSISAKLDIKTNFTTDSELLGWFFLGLPREDGYSKCLCFVMY
ncbi:13498_t:CDS:1, partial [Gigaspora rosea]